MYMGIWDMSTNDRQSYESYDTRCLGVVLGDFFCYELSHFRNQSLLPSSKLLKQLATVRRIISELFSSIHILPPPAPGPLVSFSDPVCFKRCKNLGTGLEVHFTRLKILGVWKPHPQNNYPQFFLKNYP